MIDSHLNLSTISKKLPSSYYVKHDGNINCGAQYVVFRRKLAAIIGMVENVFIITETVWDSYEQLFLVFFQEISLGLIPEFLQEFLLRLVPGLQEMVQMGTILEFFLGVSLRYSLREYL